MYQCMYVYVTGNKYGGIISEKGILCLKQIILSSHLMSFHKGFVEQALLFHSFSRNLGSLFWKIFSFTSPECFGISIFFFFQILNVFEHLQIRSDISKAVHMHCKGGFFMLEEKTFN